MSLMMIHSVLSMIIKWMQDIICDNQWNNSVNLNDYNHHSQLKSDSENL